MIKETIEVAPSLVESVNEERRYWGCFSFTGSPEKQAMMDRLVWIVLYTSPEEAVKAVTRMGMIVDSLESFTIKESLGVASAHGLKGVRIKDRTGDEFPVIMEIPV